MSPPLAPPPPPYYRPEEQPPLPPGPPPPPLMRRFGGDHYSPTQEFTFQYNHSQAPAFPPDSRIHPDPHAQLRRRPDPRRPRDQQNRGYSHHVGPSHRPLLTSRRGATPERLRGMSAEQDGRRFMSADDVSDSDEKDMDVESEADESSNVPVDNRPEDEAEPAEDQEVGQPTRKKRAQEKGSDAQTLAASVPKWSNPDPYTVLPPTDDSKRKKDVVKLIRKARVVQAEQQMANNAVTANDDFISLDFADDQDAEQETGRPVPTGPRSFSHRDALHDNDSGRAPGTTGPTQSASSLGPPPTGPSHQLPVDLPVDLEPQPSIDNALGSRKRTYDDEIIRESSIGRGGLKKRPRDIVTRWVVKDPARAAPWCDVDHSKTDNMGFWLHKEICDFFTYIKPREYENQVRQDIIQRLRHAISNVHRDCDIYCFGSYAAGVYLPNADMDLVCISERFLHSRVPKMELTLTKALWKIHEVIRSAGIAKSGSIQVVSKAKVPLVKYIDGVTGIPVDLSFENSTGLEAVRNYNEWKEQFPAMPIIVSVIKQFLQMRSLNEVRDGGLGGFSVTCMVTSLLQSMPQVQSGNLIPEEHLGEILMEFLDLYGNRFDTRRTGIRVNPPGYFRKPSSSRGQKVYAPGKEERLSIEDPNRPENDISGGTSQIKVILDCFSRAHEALQKRMYALRRADFAARQSKSILETILGGNYKILDEQRERLKRVFEARNEVHSEFVGHLPRLVEVDQAAEDMKQDVSQNTPPVTHIDKDIPGKARQLQEPEIKHTNGTLVAAKQHEKVHLQNIPSQSGVMKQQSQAITGDFQGGLDPSGHASGLSNRSCNQNLSVLQSERALADVSVSDPPPEHVDSRVSWIDQLRQAASGLIATSSTKPSRGPRVNPKQKERKPVSAGGLKMEKTLKKSEGEIMREELEKAKGEVKRANKTRKAAKKAAGANKANSKGTSAAGPSAKHKDHVDQSTGLTMMNPIILDW